MEHKPIFYFKGKHQWEFLALGPTKDSCVLTRPVTITTLPRSPAVRIATADGITEPLLVLVSDLDSVEAYTYQFLSFMGLWFAYPQARSYLKPGILCVVVLYVCFAVFV